MQSVTLGVTNTANLCLVLTFFNECPKTCAPKAYESFVAKVTQALSEKKYKKINYIHINILVIFQQ